MTVNLSYNEVLSDKIPKFFTYDVFPKCLSEVPFTSKLPPDDLNSPVKSFIVVVFPDPLGPSSPNTSPLATSKSIPRSEERRVGKECGSRGGREDCDERRSTKR